ncbi:MAG: hypothetical protein C5B57_12940 [Blastocatellia bacterium]|nr:MAG: hypothetical protein C5B57_12940 [Blastocatellia bacterium]
MRNDARPMGEKLRDLQLQQKRGSGAGPSERAQETRERKPFVTDRDMGDEESQPSEEGSTLSKKS